MAIEYKEVTFGGILFMSFSSFFSAFGSALGGALGGGIFSTVGRFAGKMLGQYLDNTSYTPPEHYQYKKQLEMLFLSLDVYAKPIPLVFGKAKSCGVIIWSEPLREVEDIASSARYFSDSSVRSINHVVSYSYFATFAVAICQGKIDGIEKVWADGKLIDLSCYNYTLYTGNQDQGADPIIAEHYGDKTCAFRDLAYIVFKDLPLDEFGNKVPELSFEVVRKIQSSQVKTVEDLVKSMVMIPGSGEFVYDTVVQYKIYKNPQGAELYKEVINSHNHKGIANSIYSLDQLMSVCNNLESIAVVVCWFGDSLDIASCSILPAVEYKDEYTRTSEDWSVAGFDRNSAKLIGRQGMHPRYGGSINDASLVRYLQELKRRGLKVMLLPMFFMDLPGKPWRGHLTGSCQEVADFFNKQHGYNNFILHYATLCKDLLSAFVIGSELKQITSIRTSDNQFPAVSELIKLAQMVKSIVGSSVKTTYAADWSEYHHAQGGWFNLDALWASSAIDFVGIDAYVPLTSSVSSQISDQEILQGWSSGEGFDYFVDSDGNKKELSCQYAWKNFHYWWSNFHTNPDGKQTAWKPCMKKICFTEFGFPSIDKATNQPNVFYDPNCLDGASPIYSNGYRDFSLQRRAIKLSLQHWQNNPMLEAMYLWTWDARPYPAWPDYNVWNDGYLWEKGHWVNNKFGVISLASVVAEICRQAGIGADEIDVENLDIAIEGVIFEKNLSSLDAINLLRCCYFFDIYQDKERLVFKKRGTAGFVTSINQRDLLKSDKAKHFEFSEISASQTLNQVHISFINQNKKYHLDYLYVNVDSKSDKAAYFLHLPIVLSEVDAAGIAEMIINNARAENKMLILMLPITYLHLCPCDIITINISNCRYHLRIVDIALAGLALKITLLCEDVAIYSLPCKKPLALLEYKPHIEEIKFLDLPALPWNSSRQHYAHLAYQGNLETYLQASLDDKNFDKVCKITRASILGRVISFQSDLGANFYVIDNTSYFVLYSLCKLRTLSDDEFWGRRSFISIGREILRYKHCQQIADNTYKISHLIRGELATEKYINTHVCGQDFVVIGKNITNISIDQAILDRDLFFKVGSKKLSHKVARKILPPPVNLGYCLKDRLLKLWWVGRSMVYDDWIAVSDNNVTYQIEVSGLGESIHLQAIEPCAKILLPENLIFPIEVRVQSLCQAYSSASCIVQILNAHN